MKPRIGLSTTTGHEISGSLPSDYPRINIAADYVQALVALGAVPIMLPLIDPTGRADVVESMLDGLDAVVLTGGHDLDPAGYGASPIAECGETLPHRDAFDRLVFDTARRRGLPVMGICRGFQLINVIRGGTLHQHLPLQRPSEVAHVQTGQPTEPSHLVHPEPDGWLARATGVEPFPVVSFHHQGVDRLGEGLVVEALAPDGLVEAYRGAADEPFLFAVQWHPEMSHHHDPKGLEVLSLVVDAARG